MLMAIGSNNTVCLGGIRYYPSESIVFLIRQLLLLLFAYLVCQSPTGTKYARGTLVGYFGWLKEKAEYVNPPAPCKGCYRIMRIPHAKTSAPRDSSGQTRQQSSTLSAALCAFTLLLAACDKAPYEAADAKLSSPSPPTSVIHLSGEESDRARVQVQPVTRGEFRTFLDFPATVQPNANRVADITTLVRGRAMDIRVDLGQDVKAGDLLATLYSSELGFAQSSYLKANAKQSVAEQAFTRARHLLEEKVIGQAEYQRREGDLLSVRAETREARDRLRLLGMTEESIRRLARDQTIRSTVPIHAPFTGRVIARNLTLGEVVETTEKLFVLADLSDVWVVANVPEKDVIHITGEQHVEVRLTAYPDETFQGRITYVSDVLDPATRTLRLRVLVPNPHRRLKPEMYARVRVWGSPEPGTLLVPARAVQQDGGEHVAFVQTGEREFVRRPIRLGDESDGMVKVLDGLHEGELVVTTGAFELKSELASRQRSALIP